MAETDVLITLGSANIMWQFVSGEYLKEVIEIRNLMKVIRKKKQLTFIKHAVRKESLKVSSNIKYTW